MLRESIDDVVLDEAIRLAGDAHPSDANQDDSTSAVDRIIAGESPHTVERQALNAFLEQLAPDELAVLVALMWLGRSDAGEEPSVFSDLVTTARNENHAIDYLASCSARIGC